MNDEFFLTHSPVLLVLIGLLSLTVGSFLNVVIHRLPLMLQTEWRIECRNLLQQIQVDEKKINLFFPRSFCPGCNHLIHAWQNIPLISYILLRGRCHHCKSTISLRYPIVEILSMMGGVLAAWHFGFTITLLFALLFVWLIICLCFIDLEHQLLPDSLSLSLLWLGLLVNTKSLFTSLPDAVFSAAGAYLSLWIIIKLFYLCTGKIGMGNGDFKLFAALGAWFGWMQLPIILMLSSISGAIIGIIYLKNSKQTYRTPIPFGPFLCVSGLIVLFYGRAIINVYIALNAIAL